MKTLLIYMSDDMTTHDLSIHHYLTIRDGDNMDEHFNSKMNSYRDHFKGKHVAKMVITVLSVNDETGASTIIYEEQFVHPLKPKIVINKPVGAIKRPLRAHVPGGFFSTPPSAIAAFAAQQAALNAQQMQGEAQINWEMGSETTAVGNV